MIHTAVDAGLLTHVVSCDWIEEFVSINVIGLNRTASEDSYVLYMLPGLTQWMALRV